MKKSGLRKLIGNTVRIRPVPRRMFRGAELASIDDHWLALPSTAPGALLTLHLLGGGHAIDLAADAVRHFAEPDVLVLRVQLTITERTAYRDPIPYDSPLLSGLPDYRSWGEWMEAGAPHKNDPVAGRLTTG